MLRKLKLAACISFLLAASSFQPVMADGYWRNNILYGNTCYSGNAWFVMDHYLPVGQRCWFVLNGFKYFGNVGT